MVLVSFQQIHTLAAEGNPAKVDSYTARSSRPLPCRYLVTRTSLVGCCSWCGCCRRRDGRGADCRHMPERDRLITDSQLTACKRFMLDSTHVHDQHKVHEQDGNSAAAFGDASCLAVGIMQDSALLWQLLHCAIVGHCFSLPPIALQKAVAGNPPAQTGQRLLLLQDGAGCAGTLVTLEGPSCAVRSSPSRFRLRATRTDRRRSIRHNCRIVHGLLLDG